MGVPPDLTTEGHLARPKGSQAVDIDYGQFPAVSSEAYFRAATATLATQPSRMKAERTAELLKQHYGLSGLHSTLSSELERTEMVELSDGRRLIFKTSTQPEAIDSFRFQSAAIAGVQGGAGFVTPTILRTKSNALMFEEDGVCGYVQNWVAGVPLHQANITPDLLFRTGSALGRLNLALEVIDTPAIHRPILWHIGCWPRLLELEQYLPSGLVADNVRAAMSNYIECVEPQLSGLAWQVTHNDPSPFNTLVTENGLGFIDFGDGCWGPRIQDLAIAASHLVNDPTLALGGAEYLIAGYASVIPLSTQEAKMLVRLMRARQSALILINYWRSHLFPADAQYIKKNVARAERGLSILAPLGVVDAERAVLTATNLLSI
ncbi:phosphotransferase enzyme family protein [Agrobacterium vitis]|uniref:phosphotransferase enzyme family protein n=1 Tax=Agrobacterium vitis TaxID=373 RepID=UPI003D26FDDE